MFLSVGYLVYAFARWYTRYRRRKMLLNVVRRAFRTSSIVFQKGPVARRSNGQGCLKTNLVEGSLFAENKLLVDEHTILSSIQPKQIVNLSEWTSYFAIEGHFEEDSHREDVMVLLEAVRPQDVETFIKHEFSVPPVERIHVLSHGAPIAWRSGAPFGILLHCSLEEFVILGMAFVDGALTMDEDLEVHQVLSVETKGCPSSLVSKRGEDATMTTNTESTNKNQNAASQSVQGENILITVNSGDCLLDSQIDTERQSMDFWSNESLAENSSVGRLETLEGEVDGQDEDVDVGTEYSFPESGSGEALCDDLDASASTMSSTLSRSWNWVRTISVIKPPNILVYCGRKDTARKFEIVKSLLSHSLDPDCYVIYHLKHNEVQTTPWIDNTALLVITPESVSDAEEAFVSYFQSGGKVLSLGSNYDSFFVGKKELRSNVSVTDVTFKTWDNISLIAGRYAYCTDDVKMTEVSVSQLAVDATQNCVIVKASQKSKKTSGCAVLSQILFDKEPGDLAVTPAMFNLLKKSNKSRFEILSELLSILGMECNSQGRPPLTPCVLIPRNQTVKQEFLKSFENRLVSGILKSDAVSLKFTSNVAEPVGAVLLPVLPTVNMEAVSQNFDVALYWENLTSENLGNMVFYIDVVPSTMPLLDSLQFSAPQTVGMIAIARQQTSAKGRGGNSWLSPVGCAVFTMHVRIPLESYLGKSISYLQHITSLAVVQSVCDLPGYQKIDLRLKWPNDIYYSQEVKLGGVIVKSTIMDGMVHAMIGCGFNVDNSNPTICINDLIQLYNRQNMDNLEPCKTEQLIARTVSNIEQLINQFQKGGRESFCQQYYDKWLHSNAKVTLQSEGNLEVMILGVDEYGYLLVETPSGEKLSVQPDGNSFDMMKNLITLKTR